MIAVFTGTRSGGLTTHPEVGHILEMLRRKHGDELTVFVGDCPTGVDFSVRYECKRLGIDFAVFVANWDVYDNAAGPRRNGAMIQAAQGLQAAAAFVTVYYRASSDRSPGTRDCVRRAKAGDLRCVCIGGPEL